MEHIDLMYLSLISYLLPIAFGIIVFKRLPVSLMILAIYIVVAGLMDLGTFIMFTQKLNNMVLFHSHTYVEFLSLSAIYFFVFRHKRILQRVIGILGIVFLCFSLASLIYWEGITQFNSIQRMIEYGILMVYFFIFFSQVINSRRAPFLELHPYFLLTMGLFIYFSGTLLVFLNANNFIELGIVDFWMIHGFLNVFLNIIYAIVLWNGSRVAKHL